MKAAVFLGAAVLWCVPCLAKAQSADERLRAIYTEEWKWRLEQFPGLEGITKPVPDRLPKVDPAAQEIRLRYWQDVLHDVISYDDVVMSEIWEAQAASLLVFGCQPKLTLLHAS
jgi:hypothetical protein